MSEKEIAWAHCNRCNNSTRHNIVHSERVVLEDEIAEGCSVTYWDDYTLLKCSGCDTVHLKHESAFSEITGLDGEPEVTTTIYPPRISRNKPAWFGSIDGPFWTGKSEIEQLLEEIYAALHNNSLRLAAMGVRALLDFIMIDKVGDNGSIGENVKVFLNNGYVAPINQETFRTKLIEAGHAAMHRGYTPEISDLGTLLDLTELLIASIYVHPARAKGLKKRIPDRRPSKA